MPRNSGRLPLKARQRPITAPTGAVLPARPRSNGGGSSPRPVIPARTPNRSLPSARANRGTGPGTRVSAIRPLDGGAQGLEAALDVLVAAVDLPDVVNRALPLGRKRGEEHRHPGPDIGRFHGPAAELSRTGDDGAVRIAEHDPGSHPDQLVHEEEPGLEHLLEH